VEKSNHILVVDDKREDGEAVIRSLWKDHHSALFYNFDIETPLVPEEVKDKHCGIRVVFQDILLFPGRGTPGNLDYGAAQGVLESLLSEDNGPWLMVAWSTWADDPDVGDKYAKELFDFLHERLSEGKKPYSYVVIDKRPFTTDGNHGAVKHDDDLTDKEKTDILESIRTELSKAPALSILTAWESDIKKCGSGIVNNLWGLVDSAVGQTLDEREARLLELLFKLGKSQDGRLKPSDDIASPVYELLAELLSDLQTTLPNRSIKHTFTGGDPGIDPSLINSMLHWDSSVSQKQVPGIILLYPDEIDGVEMINFGSDKKKCGFIFSQFIPEANQDAAKKDTDFSNHISMVILDITPPCDHAQRKAGWRRYIVGLKVNDECQKHFFNDNKLANDALRSTPLFSSTNEKFLLIFNSRLICSIPDQTKKFKNIPAIGRLKEQLLKDIVNWNGSMSTRPGIVRI